MWSRLHSQSPFNGSKIQLYIYKWLIPDEVMRDKLSVPSHLPDRDRSGGWIPCCARTLLIPPDQVPPSNHLSPFLMQALYNNLSVLPRSHSHHVRPRRHLRRPDAERWGGACEDGVQARAEVSVANYSWRWGTNLHWLAPPGVNSA